MNFTLIRSCVDMVSLLLPNVMGERRDDRNVRSNRWFASTYSIQSHFDELRYLYRERQLGTIQSISPG